MKIETAIKILTLLHKFLFDGTDPNFLDAIKLGIEALKRIERQRFDLEPYERKLLPGEVEE